MQKHRNDDVVKMKIANALVSLMLDRDYSTISIIDVVDYADISRSTFYRHFQSKESVLKYCFDNIIIRFYASISLDFSTPEGYRAAIRHTFHTIKTYKRILRATIDADCTHIIRNYIDEQYERAYLRNGKVDMMAYLYSGAFSNLIIKWLGENCETDIDELTADIIKITRPEFQIK